MSTLLIVALLGLGNSFLSNMAGGGGARILFPALVLLGFAPIDAVGTIKLGALGLGIGSALTTKGKEVVRMDHMKPLLLIVIAASLLGPIISLNLSQDIVKVISSTMIVITAVASIISWRMAKSGGKVSAKSKYTGYLLYFVAVTLLAGFGSSIGLLMSYIIIGFLGFSAIEAVSTRRVLGLVGLPLQILPFALQGSVDYLIGSVLFVGMAAGGYIGLHTAMKLGSGFLRGSMAVMSIILVGLLFI